MIALNALSRLTAVPCQARDVQEAQQLPLESGNIFFKSPAGVISRVTITGLLISWDGVAGMLDDGTGQILFRPAAPEQHGHEFLREAAVGSILFLVARIRVVGIEKYLSVESAQILHDPYWLTYRKFEIALFREAARPLELQAITPTNAHQLPERQENSLQESVLATIRLLDAGDGADVELVLKRTKRDDDDIIQALIKQGDIYEPKPGKLKVLE